MSLVGDFSYLRQRKKVAPLSRTTTVVLLHEVVENVAILLYIISSFIYLFIFRWQ